MQFPHYGYLLILIASISSLLVFDRKKGLALFRQPRRTLYTLCLSVALFIAWDIAGLALAIFQTNQRYVTGLHLVTPNLPIEEFLFLGLIAYFALILTLILGRRER